MGTLLARHDPVPKSTTEPFFGSIDVWIHRLERLEFVEIISAEDLKFELTWPEIEADLFYGRTD